VQSAFKIALGVFTITFGMIIIIFYPMPIVNFIYSLFDVDIPDPFYILVLGTDDAGEAGKDRTDFIGIVGLKIDEKKIFFMSIPRDLIVEDMVDGKVRKINAVYKKLGLKTLENIIENIVGIRLNRYVIVNYSAFKTLGDKLGPIKIDVEKPMHYDDYHQDLHIHFDPGLHKMKGKELLEYIRFRHDEEGDIGRMRRQRKVLKAIMESAKEKLNLFTLPALFRKLMKEDVKTDIDIVELIVLYWKYRDLNDITFLSFPCKINSSGDLVLDKEKLEKLRKNLKNFNFEVEGERTIKVLVVKANGESTYSFEARFRKIADEVRKKEPRISLSIVNMANEPRIPECIRGENAVIVLSNEIWKMETMKKVVSSFDIPQDNILIPGINWKIEDYYEIIDSLGKSRIYMVVDDYDFIITLGRRI